MAVYLISYDISEKDVFEYQGLWDELERIGAVRILYSEWVVVSSSNCNAIYNAVAKKTQLKDRLLVVELRGTAVWDKVMIDDDAFKKIMASG